MGVAGLAVSAERDELHVVQAGRFDASAADQTPAVGQQHDLEHDAGGVGAGASLVVAKARIESAEVEFVVDQVIEREFKAAGLDLLAQHNRQEPGLRSICLYLAMSCSPALSVSTSTLWRAACSRSAGVFAQPQRLNSADKRRRREDRLERLVGPRLRKRFPSPLFIDFSLPPVFQASQWGWSRYSRGAAAGNEAAVLFPS